MVGFLALRHEAYFPAPEMAIGPTFPVNSLLALDSHRPTLMLFVHPQCPCTKATFDELDELRLQTNDRLAVTIVFTIPANVPTGWEKGELLTMAEKMQGIHVVLDPGGSLAGEFHVLGSGHVLVYSSAGRLLFSGGITPSRGHEGDSAGRSAIVQLTKGPAPPKAIREPVFGCTLL